MMLHFFFKFWSKLDLSTWNDFEDYLLFIQGSDSWYPEMKRMYTLSKRRQCKIGDLHSLIAMLIHRTTIATVNMVGRSGYGYL
jgi:hypothetical protein